MLYDLGLVATVAICGWLALDLLTATGSRRRALWVVVLAVACGLFATGELLFARVGTAAERQLAFQVQYLGICLLPLAWLAVAAQAGRPRWWRHASWVLTAAAVPLAFFYSCLFWDSGGLFIDPAYSPPRRGPLFWAMAGYAWLLIVTGWVYFARAAVRLRRAEPARLAVLTAGTLTPLVGNAVYLAANAWGIPIADPTPILLGFGALMIRIAVVDSGLLLYLPLARSELLEQVEVGIVVADLEGRVVDANWAARRLTGTSELRGLGIDELIESVCARADAVIEVRRFPLRSAVAVVGSAAFLADRTDAQNAERRLALAARLEALGFLTAGIAHEVNNPLAFIRANLAQLEKMTAELAAPGFGGGLPPEVRVLAAEGAELLTDTQEGVDRIVQLVARLRSFARSEPESESRPALVDLAQVAEAAAAMAGVGLPEDSIRCRLVRVPPVRAVEGELVQIALNLLVNAVQASAGVPDVEVEVEAAEQGVALHVRDRGCGLAADVLPRVFDPFFTTKPPGVGTGLGLSLSYDLARRNDGRLEAANRPSGGAEFTLWLPRAE
ncbi:MAG: ATP-binding protein [Deltaproteobacteria bacterium]|nr:ATP-binding protein [Deltaproteobacteria bacterium]